MNSLQNLSEIFSKKIFYIPDYQRGYAWTEEQRNDLIEDIEDTLRVRRLKTNNKYMHFTGTVVAKKLPEKISLKGESFDCYDIVDGQQRITTLNIFLNEIANKYLDLGGQDNLDTSNNIRKISLKFKKMYILD